MIEHDASAAAVTVRPAGRQPFAVSPDQAAAIARVGHFAAGSYGRLDVARTIEFFARRYVDQLAPFRDLTPSTVIADTGAGYGWLAMALAAHTPARIIAVEPDGARLMAGREIAAILGIADRIEWRIEGLGSLGLPDRTADIVYSVEVLEHIDGSEAGVRDLARISRDVIVATTPNLWFPVIAHDTRLPFCHWLPRPARRAYAAAFGRAHMEDGNIFWSPRDLTRIFAGFRPISGFLHYRTLQDYLATYPAYLPYDGGRSVPGPGRPKRFYYRAAASLGSASRYVLPNLAAVWERVPE